MHLKILQQTIFVSLIILCTHLLSAGNGTASQYEGRRKALMEKLPDGIVLLQSVSGLKRMEQSGFRQDPSFYYFTGLENAQSCVLSIDAQSKQTWLFVPIQLSGIASFMKRPLVKAGKESESLLMIDHVVSTNDFLLYLKKRKIAGPKSKIYFDDQGASGLAEPNATPSWREEISKVWGQDGIASASKSIQELRSIKSSREIEILRRSGAVSSDAMMRALAGLKPGVSQRHVEASVVSECLTQGGEGPSFWPWIMTGPNSAFPAPFESFGDYRHLNRIMKDGELARVDVGCEVDHYQGDVGRTAPVSGRFDAGQRETWELLIQAYKAGLNTIRDGVKTADVLATFRSEVQRLKPTLRTPLAKKAVEVLSTEEGFQYCQIHGIGLEPAEGETDVLHAGMVVDFEPIFSVDEQGFYLEDMILIKENGYEILTKGLPYSADEIEKVTGKNHK